MLVWICDNITTIIVSGLILVAAAVALISLIRDKKNGKSSCGSCSGCAMSDYCHQKKQ